MSRFIDVFRELGSFSEVLQTQLELLLCERLQQTWVKVRHMRLQPWKSRVQTGILKCWLYARPLSHHTWDAWKPTCCQLCRSQSSQQQL